MAKRITDLPELTTPDSADVLPVVDVSANSTKRITLLNMLSNFIDAVHLKTNSVITSKILDGAVTPPKWANPYKFRAYMSTSQSLPATTWTKLNMDTVTFDTNNNFSTANKGYTIPVNGYYTFFASALLLSQGGSPFLVGLSKTGTTEFRRLGELPNTSGNATINGSSTDYYTAGEVVYAVAYSGQVKTINGGDVYCYFGGYLVSVT